MYFTYIKLTSHITTIYENNFRKTIINIAATLLHGYLLLKSEAKIKVIRIPDSMQKIKNWTKVIRSDYLQLDQVK